MSVSCQTIRKTKLWGRWHQFIGWSLIAVTITAIGLCIDSSAGGLLDNGTDEPSASTSATRESDKHYTLGTEIAFGQGGESERYRVTGWSTAEPRITWSTGNAASLEFTGIAPGTPLRLKITMGALFSPPALASQPVQLYANGERVADWNVSNDADFTAEIPGRLITSTGKLDIELRTPKATSPKSLGQNEDTRVLGVHVFRLVIEQAS